MCAHCFSQAGATSFEPCGDKNCYAKECRGESNAPKPEMLEKASAAIEPVIEAARKALRCLYAEVDESVARDVGSKVDHAIIALRSALRASEVETQNSLAGWRKANDRIREQMVKLDEAEASVESLRKERDKEHAEREEWRAATQRMTIMVQEQASATEAARAEATKAVEGLEMMKQRCATQADRDRAKSILAAIRAPRPPEPENILTKVQARRLRVHAETCAVYDTMIEGPCDCAPSSPTPPSEEPMEEESGPCCEDHYADRCNHGIYPKENCWNCFPSPEPPREEPSK